MVNKFKWLSVLLFIASFITTNAIAQDQEKNMSLSVEPASLLSGAIPITFGVKLADRFSLGLTGYDKFFSFTKAAVSGVGGGLSAKFHLSADAYSNGWYLKPEVMAGYWIVGESSTRTIGYGLEPRLVAGYDWVWPTGFILSLGLGIKYAYFSGDKNQVRDITGFGFHEVFPNADFGVGWAF